MIESKFGRIGFGTPLEERILLYWENSQHIEDGKLFFDENHDLYHVLFDGERLNDEPTHWMYIPEVEQ